MGLVAPRLLNQVKDETIHLDMRNFPTQYNLKPEDTLYFCHIPKTAGMTFRTILEDYFQCDDICPATLTAHIADYSKADLQRYRLFRGHLGYVNIPELLDGKDLVNVTVLREPVSRVISHYDYIRRTPGDPHHDMVRNMSLEEYSLSKGAGKLGRNVQTYHVARLLQYDLTGLTRRKILNLAKQSIDKFAFAGILERFQDSLFLLSYIFGWKPIINSRKENVAKSRKTLDELPADTLELLKSHSWIDQELYRYAKAIFEDRFNQMVQDLLNKYGTDEQRATYAVSGQHPDQDALQQLLEHHSEQRFKELQYPPAEAVEYNFCEPLRGLGWQRRECAADDLAHRWMGPVTTATLDLPIAIRPVTATPVADLADMTIPETVIPETVIPETIVPDVTDSDAIALSTAPGSLVPNSRDDYLVEFQVPHLWAVAPDILESLTLQVNSHPIPLITLHSTDALRIYQGRVPHNCLGGDRYFTQLAFQVNRTAVCKNANPLSKDTRLVGVALNYVQVFPSALEAQKSFLRLFVNEQSKVAAAFVSNHLEPQERVVAPLMFKVLLPAAIDTYDTFLGSHESLQWVILHKGIKQQMEALLWKLAQQGFKPVFADDVFVVFVQNRNDLSGISYLSPHVRHLYLGRYAHQVRYFFTSIYEERIRPLYTKYVERQKKQRKIAKFRKAKKQEMF